MTMDKYVKANRVKEECADSCKYVRVGNEEYLSVGDVCRIVDEMPSADVVEVVRCKDCKYSYYNPINVKDYSLYCQCKVLENRVYEDYFCAEGERRYAK